MRILWEKLHWILKNIIIGGTIILSIVTLNFLNIFGYVILLILSISVIFGLGAGVRALYNYIISEIASAKSKRERELERINRKRSW